jgi:hypothetical protein
MKDTDTFKRWLLLNSLIPALNLTDGDNSTPPPTCHDMAYRPLLPPKGTAWLCVSILLLVPLAMLAGVLFATHRPRQHWRRRHALDRQLGKGVLTQEECLRLR